MPTPEEHAQRRRVLAATTSAAILAQWRQVDPDAIARTWTGHLPSATAMLSAGQLAAARTADDYLDEFSDVAEGQVDPRAFAGRASDGGGLASLLYQPVISALMSIGSGASPGRALAGAGASLDMIVRTQVADAGRTADQVALTARRTISGYVRQISGPTCSRCTILAGRFYRWNAGFQRHPRCDCIHVPATREQWRNDPRFHDPQQVYDSLSVAERQRAGWSLADQQAIADGADLTAVTNMKGVTSSGAKRRAGRPLPSEIYKQAGSRDEAIRLLREHGYIRGGAVRVPVTRGNLMLAATRPPEDLAGWTVLQLRALAKERGIKIPAGSRKADIVRLLGGASDDLAGKTVAQLRELARERGVKLLARDRKADIVAKLRGAPASAKTALVKAPAKAAAKKVPTGTLRTVPVTRAELAKLEGQAELPVLTRQLKAATTEEDRRRLQRLVDVAQDKITQRVGSTLHNWDSPWWSEAGGFRLVGRGPVPEAMLREHIESIVSAELPNAFRTLVIDELVRQAAITARSVLELRGIAAFRFYDVGHDSAWAYFNSRHIYFNPDKWRAEFEVATKRKWLDALGSGWWSKTDSAEPVFSTLAHEFGHHVAYRVLNFATTADLAKLAKAFDEGLALNGYITRSIRAGKDFKSVVDNLLRDHAITATRISAYGMTNHQELMAEIWHEFTTSANPRPHIKRMGQIMLDLAERSNIIRL